MRTDRRSFVSGLAAGILTAPRPAAAQLKGKIPRIGILATGFPETIAHLLDAFKQGLREHGYVEGQHVLIDVRYGEAKAERLSLLAGELVRLNVDIIVAVPNPAIEAVKRATPAIPIVMPIGSDPVGVGLVASLARPGGNITGLSAYSPELNGKRLEILKETVPKLSRVALLTTPNVPGNAVDLRDTEASARSLRLRTRLLEVGSSSALADVFRTMTQERVEAFIVFPGQPTLFVNRKQVVELAAKNGLPAMYPLADYVDLGGLISYGVNNREMFRRAAAYVDKILKGAKPAELPIEQPTTFELVINLKTARALGLTIPPSLRLRADQVIE